MPLLRCAVLVALAAPGLQLFRTNPLDFTLHNSPTSQKYLIETMPGGVALLDYNGDGSSTSSRRSHICEGAVGILAIEAIPERRVAP